MFPWSQLRRKGRKLTTQDVMIVLFVASAHFTIASMFNEIPRLNLWLLAEYGKLANGWYELYLETKSDRSQSPKKIEKVRQETISYLRELDEITGMHSSLTRKRNLYLGSWLTYATICLTIHFSQRKVTARLRRNRNARIRRENLRA